MKTNQATMTMRLAYGPTAHTFGWMWTPTGRSRLEWVYGPRRVRQWEWVGREYALTAAPPADGGDVPSGTYGDARPTGETSVIWRED